MWRHRIPENKYVSLWVCNMWKIHSHMLAPVTKITPSKVKFKWTKIEQEALEEIKRILACNFL